MKTKFTVQEFAAANGIENKDDVRPVVVFLEKMGKIKIVGEQKSASGKGKGSNIYEGSVDMIQKYLAGLKFPT